MPIPQFDQRGLLPPFVGTDPTTADRSPYTATIVEFATQFATTTTRKQLIRNLIAYRALMATGGFVSGVQFLDGSFLENVEQSQGRDPGDIDVLSLLTIPQSYHNSPTWAAVGLPFWSSEIADQPRNKVRFSLDTYALPYPPAHFGDIQTLFYWHSLFGHQKVTLAWKGFVIIPLDANADTIALGML